MRYLLFAFSVVGLAQVAPGPPSGTGNFNCAPPTVAGNIPVFTNTLGTGCVDSGIPTSGGRALSPVTGASSPSGYVAPFLTRGPAMVGIGDSITLANDDATFGVHYDSFLNYAQYSSGSKVYLAYNAGIGGNTTTQMVARFSADVLAHNPQIINIMGGTNDTTPLSQTLPNLKSMIYSSLAYGAQPVLCTIPPQGTAAIATPTGLTLTPSTMGGTLSTGTKAYRVSALNAAGETLAIAEVTTAVVGPTGSVLLTWNTVVGATGYKIYGRASGAELLIGTNGTSGAGKPTLAFTDDGSVTPSGALPVSNTTAVAYDATTQDKITLVNNIVTQLAIQFNVPLVDMYSLLVEPTTGLYKTGYTTDGTHPTLITDQLMGALWATTMASYIAPGRPYIASAEQDTTVLYTNPLFTLNNGTLPTGWIAYGGTDGVESITTDSAVLGSVYQIARADATPRFGNSANITGWTVGHTLAFSGMVKITQTGGQAALQLITSGGSSGIACSYGWSANTGAYVPFYCEGPVSAGTTAVYIQTVLQYGPVTLDLGQITVRDLTALGIRPLTW